MMKTIDVVVMMKTAATVTPLEGDNKFLVKYGNHKRAIITVEQAPQPPARAPLQSDGAKAHPENCDCRECHRPAKLAEFIRPAAKT
jgi:hypothetical protein